MTTSTRPTTSSAPVQRVEVSADLKGLMRRRKLGALLTTLPERLALAHTQHLPHHEFLEMLLADEVTRRDHHATDRRAREANLDPTMVLKAWDDSTTVAFDRTLWAELCSLRFLDQTHNVMILRPVGVGKTFLANALGHAAVRRKYSVHLQRADKLFKRLRAARRDHTHDDAMRKLHRVQLLIIDDLALQPLGTDQTNDFYELVVQRHRQHSTIITSNRKGPEIPTMMADQLLGQSALDRSLSAAFELVVEGDSYRQRQRPLLDQKRNAS